MESSVLPNASRRPKESLFFQQKLRAWHPRFLARSSGTTFLIFSVVFIILGAILIVASNKVIELKVEYTDCTQTNTQKSCADVAISGSSCLCELTVSIESDIPGPVFLYYQLQNFHQNHRRYARSKSDKQLLGNPQQISSLGSCSPYISTTNTNGTFAFLPCGAIANSIFNDSFTPMFESVTVSSIALPMSFDGIAWNTDIDRKFGTLSPEALTNTIKPPNWNESITERSSQPFKTDESLMVWMRPAALPNFRKLYARVSHSKDPFKNGIPKGTLKLRITYNFPVKSFGGRKFFTIGNTSWIGGKNLTLGITALVVGIVHFLLSIAFFLLHPYSRRMHTLTRVRRSGQARLIRGNDSFSSDNF